eukprot:2478595-Prymnesium_polylepis.1
MQRDSQLFAKPGDAPIPCPFPIQISFAVKNEGAHPVQEAVCRHILEYTHRGRFRFKLSVRQCEDLVHIMRTTSE